MSTPTTTGISNRTQAILVALAFALSSAGALTAVQGEITDQQAKLALGVVIILCGIASGAIKEGLGISQPALSRFAATINTGLSNGQQTILMALAFALSSAGLLTAVEGEIQSQTWKFALGVIIILAGIASGAIKEGLGVPQTPSPQPNSTQKSS